MGRSVGLEVVDPGCLASTSRNTGRSVSTRATLVRQRLVGIAAATGCLVLPAIARKGVLETFLELLTAVPGTLVLTLVGPVIMRAG